MLDFSNVDTGQKDYMPAALKQTAELTEVKFEKVKDQYDTLVFTFKNEKEEEGVVKLFAVDANDDKAETKIKRLMTQITHIFHGLYGKDNFKPEWLTGKDWEDMFSKLAKLANEKLPMDCEVKLVLGNKNKPFLALPGYPHFFSTELNKCSDKFKKTDYDFFEVVKVTMDTGLDVTLPEPENELPFGDEDEIPAF